MAALKGRGINNQPLTKLICSLEYRGDKKCLQILLSYSQLGPGRKAKQVQKEISCNHLETFFLGSVYRDEIYYLQILLSRTQAGPGRTVKQEQEEISPNHVQRINRISVYEDTVETVCRVAVCPRENLSYRVIQGSWHF